MVIYCMERRVNPKTVNGYLLYGEEKKSPLKQSIVIYCMEEEEESTLKHLNPKTVNCYLQYGEEESQP